ncbi:precorrin-6y C5,15-methyltransferase (decarboxylating) subunit CbiE [Alkaliphilus peptidifermentans]|uniref:Precorrin-6Y C5,15-methyltransferase (Decarboxylating) n=1 Tax=Alkaliphilus peptidifermentans DSM 18978 TaxID=1120976 RepID=A0A1G5AQM5_9FIRM|nr:precorrin-6y C5,15-methyltransferase (decarboxylating) subunit CbiE [Alkaliphilus peptidifermentans]SCX80203.1 precorrin-6Y C5,15-methyltransferase (decarboxylating) [Alkaliphilus peptidifermentans DSM 18978]
MNKLYVIGIGPGNRDYILPLAHKTINHCQILIGGKRNLNSFPAFEGERVIIGKDLNTVVDLIKLNLSSKKIGVIVSGDTGFYSMLDYLKKFFEEDQLEVIPGISSFQYLFAKVKKPWHQTLLMSLHGRRDDYITKLRDKASITLLTDSIYTPDIIAKELMEAGLDEVEMIVGENLSYEEERIIRGNPLAVLEAKPYKMAVVVILNE